MDRFIRIKEVMELTGLAKSTVWAWVASGRLPKGTKLSSRVTVWRESEIQTWIEKQTGGAA
ncbi:helix-turn-helix transcriptional regulator [Sulfurovum sp.]|uniref:helix-turn-helix transcriptional regulator n=1 Tax=Sulfurovum sp. TaxID=1969726 RepID=UPI0035656B6F